MNVVGGELRPAEEAVEEVSSVSSDPLTLSVVADEPRTDVAEVLEVGRAGRDVLALDERNVQLHARGGTDHADADRERLDQPKAQISMARKVEADACASQLDEVAAVRHRARATLVSGQAADERELRSTREKVDGATPAFRAVPESEPRIHVGARRKPSNRSEEPEPTKDRPISRDVSPGHNVGGGIARRVVAPVDEVGAALTSRIAS